MFVEAIVVSAAMLTAPSMSTMSKFVVPSTSISPEISKLATVEVPVNVGAVSVLFVNVSADTRDTSVELEY